MEAQEPQAAMLEPPPLTDYEREQIGALRQRVRRRSPLRRAAEALYSGDALTPAEVAEAWQELCHPSAGRCAERGIACWVAARNCRSPEQRAEVIRVLLALLEGRKKEGVFTRGARAVKRTFLYAALPVTALGALAALVAELSDRGYGITLRNLIDLLVLAHGALLYAFIIAMGLTILLLPFGLLISAVTDWSNNERARIPAACALGGLGATEAVGALARAACEHDGEVQVAAVRALRRVLPHLTSQHYGALDTQAVPALCRALQWAAFTNVTLALDILAALEKVGGGPAVATVERLTRHETERVREAAARALPVVRERQRLEMAPHRLLRPVDAPADPAATLLRPVAFAPEADQSLLLRPSAVEPGDLPRAKPEDAA